MSDKIFEERLRRLSEERQPAAAQRGPATGSATTGAAHKPASPPRSAGPVETIGAPGRLGRAGPALRFGLGALWLFATMRLAAGMQTLQDSLMASEALRPHEDIIMVAVVLLIGASMIGFAWILKRTAFRVHRRDAGWALSLGAVTGFVLGVGPQEVLAIAMARAGL